MVYAVKAKKETFYLGCVPVEEGIVMMRNWVLSQFNKFEKYEHVDPMIVYMITEKEIKKEDVEVIKIDLANEGLYETLVRAFQPIGNIKMWGTKEQI